MEDNSGISFLLTVSKKLVDGGGSGAKLGSVAVDIAAFFALGGIIISLVSIWYHLKNYRKPNLQRQVIRILWMVPIYGISCVISLVSLSAAFYVDTFRDIYEAFVIYAFFTLLLDRLGGERALLTMLHSRPPSHNFFPGTLWSRDIFVGDPYTFLFVKRGILQFVYVKPVLAIMTMLLKATGNYHDGLISWTSGWAWVTFIYNLSVCLSLWCLVVFFYATKNDLREFRPLPKFLSVKAVIFFSFWQSLLIAIFVSAGLIPTNESSENLAVAIQDLLICLELIPFAVAHSYSFSYEDYIDPDIHSARMKIFYAIRDSVGLKDVMRDTVDTLGGARFNYRTFEPSEGVPYMGSSRTSRIMAGLRYSVSGASKRWVEPTQRTRFYQPPASLHRPAQEMNEQEDTTLEFDDPDPTDEVEAFYEASRKMMFGDYNFPVMDFRAPLAKRVIGRYGLDGVRTTYGATAEEGRGLLEAPLGWGEASAERRGSKGKGRNGGKEEWKAPSGGVVREGCIDVIVDTGSRNYKLNYHGPEASTQAPVKATGIPPAATQFVGPIPTPSSRVGEYVIREQPPSRDEPYGSEQGAYGYEDEDDNRVPSAYDIRRAANTHYGVVTAASSHRSTTPIPPRSYRGEADAWRAEMFGEGRGEEDEEGEVEAGDRDALLGQGEEEEDERRAWKGVFD
ncbi:organic solute transporter Ostalpha-domain-containing protein [Endogone sp. FLAS-F59071]|nr:organic solute transporter Ostalpha-domain-containing protein [Endogone sp. FLAS-F59071]|eukprot:RUS16620.1 organic solute transporter Ostalpha-domain-containing protein [Endogone sp. FLAS-F59071]